MSTLAKVLIIILVVLVALVVVLYFVGKKMQKKQAEQEAQIEAAKQTVTMLIIDKKKMKLKDAGLPAAVLEQTPKYMRRAKLPVVKAKIGPQIMSLICDASIFDIVPVKKEVKATVSGLYITGVRGLRGPLEKPVKKKKGFRAKLQEKYDKVNAELKSAKEVAAKEKAEKKANKKK